MPQILPEENGQQGWASFNCMHVFFLLDCDGQVGVASLSRVWDITRYMFLGVNVYLWSTTMVQILFFTI